MALRCTALSVFLLAVFQVGHTLSAQDVGEAAPAGEGQTVDEQLLEDLGGDLFEKADDLDEELRKALGEDLGRSTPDDDPQSDQPLERIGAQMRTAQKLLADRDASGAASRMQDSILKELDALIKKVQRQKKPGQPGGRPSGSRRSDARPQGGQPGASSAAGEQPAADSTDQLRETGGGAAVDRRALQETLLKNLWGHLPQRQREEMLQSTDDEFLPQYELEIEQYFRRLAEDPNLNGR